MVRRGFIILIFISILIILIILGYNGILSKLIHIFYLFTDDDIKNL